MIFREKNKECEKGTILPPFDGSFLQARSQINYLNQKTYTYLPTYLYVVYVRAKVYSFMHSHKFGPVQPHETIPSNLINS
jgi:hypothetical protein